MKPPFQKVLIANRGEIALRVIRACHELGIKTVAVHSKADAEALHVKLATESVCIGPALARESYLNITAIMSAAVATGADAVHPGYGFLSENAAFAEICGSCGITFIGPTARAMRTMGDKARACAGGGGRGMKIIKEAEGFDDIFQTASSEVMAAFGDGSLLVEKYLPRVRHVEVQIAGDRYQNLIHLGCRDCSVQRRYQKLVEESPPYGLSQKIIEQLQNSAVEIGKAVSYSNVGTIEFLVDLETDNYYFIEMNTRLQVEHPVTELVTGVDLVKEQIQLAAGMELSYQQKDIKITGHSIEVRVNAEDPVAMVPSPGKIRGYHAPGGHGVRVDSALYSEYTVQPYYDSLISKLIVYARTREDAISKMLVALDEYIIEGIKTNIELHKRILNHTDFRNATVHTKFLESVDLFKDLRIPKDNLESHAL